VTKKHQITFANCLMNSDLLNKRYILVDGTEMVVKDLNINVKSRISKLTELLDSEKITIAKEIEYYGQTYKKEYVVSRCEDKKICFYNILFIVIYQVAAFIFISCYKYILIFLF
jgi:hypothetical protein